MQLFLKNNLGVTTRVGSSAISFLLKSLYLVGEFVSTKKDAATTPNANHAKIETSSLRGNPIVLMINPQDAKDIWISHKQIIDKSILKEYLLKNNLTLSPFFEKQL